VGLKLVSSKILDGNGVKAMPGLIPAHNSGSCGNKKIQVASRMGHTIKIFFLNLNKSKSL